jgi:hypothetical protein
MVECFAHLFRFAILQIPASFEVTRKRDLCVLANCGNLAEYVALHEDKAVIIALAATDEVILRLFETLNRVKDVTNTDIQGSTYRVVSRCLCLFASNWRIVGDMLKCVGTVVACKALLSVVSWSIARWEKLPWGCWFLEPMWVLNLVLVFLPPQDVIEVVNVLQQSEAFAYAIRVVLGSIAGKDEDCSILAFREESVDLVLSVCFFVLRCYEYVDPRQWSEDVKLVPLLAKYMCNREFHSRKTAAACAIVLWACLGLGVILEESWVDPLRRRLALLLLQFNEELSLLQAWNAVNGSFDWEELTGVLRKPKFLLKMVSKGPNQ